MLPNLSLLILDEDALTGDVYEASVECPQPAGAGDIRNGVELTPGSSGAFLSAESTNYAISKLSTDDVEKDWKKGTVVLDKFATFMHVASAGLPENLEEGSKLRTLKRTYAHTDLDNWTWNGGDRVLINWSPNIPFQIMAGLRGASPYQRSCRFLQGDDAREVTLKPDADGVIDWPFANVAVVLPPVFYSVDETPLPILSPKAAAQLFNVVSSEIIETAVEIPQNAVLDPFNRYRTTFRSEDKNAIEALKSFFDKKGGKYKQYDTKLSTKIEDQNKKRKAFMVAVALSDTNLIYELDVRRTCMYESLSLTAHYIDFSGFVANGLWDPEIYEFQKPFAKYLTTTPALPPPVLIDSSLKNLVVLLSLLHSHEETPNTLLYAFDENIKSTDADPTQKLQTFSEKDMKSNINDFFTPETINNPLFATSLTIFDYLLKNIQKYIDDFDSSGMSSYGQRVDDLLEILIEILKIKGIQIKDSMKPYEVAYRVIEWIGDVELGKSLVKALWEVQKPSDIEQKVLLNKIDANGNAEILVFFIEEIGFTHGDLSNYDDDYNDDDYSDDD